jgi:hypothetical protein
MLGPVNCTSMAAGRPKLRIWVTMSAGWKKNSTPGKRRGSSAQQRHQLLGGAVAFLQRHQDSPSSVPMVPALL